MAKVVKLKLAIMKNKSAEMSEFLFTMGIPSEQETDSIRYVRIYLDISEYKRKKYKGQKLVGLKCYSIGLENKLNRLSSVERNL